MLASSRPQTAFSCLCSPPNCASRTWKLTPVQGSINGHLRSTVAARHLCAMPAKTYLPQSVPKQMRVLAARDMRQTPVDCPNDCDSSVAEIALEGGGIYETKDSRVSRPQRWERFGYKAIAICAGVMLGAHVWAIPSSYAADVLKTCTCLLKECRLELARCIGDPACAANVACLQTCNNRPDETECQIGCGDLFENAVVDQFNDCAVSRKQCVPQKADVGDFPVPPPTALVKNFKLSDFDGRWYISSGLNPTFDIFDCQLHEFSASPSKIMGKLSWRIKTPDGGFFTRSAVQNFKQEQSQPGILLNHDNEFLHYQDDWYILSAKTAGQPDDYIFVYYRGRNDAWDGYGGAVVYTRSKKLPTSIIPELTAAAQGIGLDFKKFHMTDNTCGPEPPLFAKLEKKLEQGEQIFVQEVKQIEEEVEKDEMTLLDKVKKAFLEFTREEDSFLKELGEEEKAVLRDLQMEASEVEKLFGKALPIRKLR